MIGTTENQVVFAFGDTTYIARKIEGSFPNYAASALDLQHFSSRSDVEAFRRLEARLL